MNNNSNSYQCGNNNKSILNETKQYDSSDIAVADTAIVIGGTNNIDNELNEKKDDPSSSTSVKQSTSSISSTSTSTATTTATQISARRKSSICPDIQISDSDSSVVVKQVYSYCQDFDEENVPKCQNIQQCTNGETICDCCKASEEHLNRAIRELKRKIEYTERVNWLCLTNRPMGPPHRKTSLPKHSEVKKKFLEICDNILADEIKAALRLPSFDSYEWDDEDVLHLMQTMFVESGLVKKFNIPIGTLREWLYEVYKHYNSVPFHNFRHCFCVAQMMYAMAWHTNLFSRLGDLEVLILLVSCICHDLDHPGYNNIYQINARTELALRYNDISPLENHHCSIAFRLLEHPDCNIFKNFSKETFKEIREGIIRCILATDMARHNEILSQFQEITPTFDFSNTAHINSLCMILIKVADISNEARPMYIAEPWLERLLQEFFAQSALEKSEGLPVTPFMDPDKISKPGSQVRFIGLVLLPLFESLGELLPELVDFIITPVRVALDYYKCLNDAQMKSRKSVVEIDGSSEGGSPQIPRSQSGISVRSRRSIPSQKSTSRTSVDEPLCISAELHDLPEDSESGDSETATEVEVAEKASKFKIDTEGNNNRNKCSQPGSRKGSREKRPSMISEMYTTSSGSRSRNSYGNIHSHYSHRFGVNRAVSLDQYSRRLSDGVQSTASDEKTMVYNRQHRSLDNECLNMTTAEKSLLNRSIPETIKISVEHETKQNLNFNKTDTGTNNECQLTTTVATPIEMTPKIVHQSSMYSTSTPKSFFSKLRQFTDRLGWKIEKDSKRSSAASVTSSSSIAAPQATNIIISSNKNNNAEPSKSGYCCSRNQSTTMTSGGYVTINNMGMSSATQSIDCTTNVINSRNRALSLDVPLRTRYSCSSSGGDSRKSSRNDDSNHLCEDNNSNHTISELNKSNTELGTENGGGGNGSSI